MIMEVSVDCADDTENIKQDITVILRRIEALSAPCKIQFLYLLIEIVLLIFVAMANRLKSRSQSTNPDTLKPEKIEQVTVRDLVKDERTHKIIGTLFLLICLFLFTYFSSYLFTWAEDQSEINRTSLFFPDKEIEIANILGTLGAWVSYQVMNNGFGLASFLICILFFVAGVNAITGRRVFKFWRHFRYVAAGVLFFCIALAFIGRDSAFNWGGDIGKMLSAWLVSTIGNFGTAAVLIAGGFAYFIWRFNPAFRLPARRIRPVAAPDVPDEETNTVISKTEKAKNRLKPGESLTLSPLLPEEQLAPMTLTEIAAKNEVPRKTSEVEPENTPLRFEQVFNPDTLPEKKSRVIVPEPELVIKTFTPEEPDGTEPEAMLIPEMAPYEPTLDLRDYKYPSMDLLEMHGSEKIIQDPAELEANKDQIINTLKNYDINILKISATVGPTVTLYEIVPVAGVRISRIKNLEDDIALSLAALGIRIIAPIPGKGTIGIEVPNVKKTVVSMRTLLASEKFQLNNYSLPIAIGKKIDNDNFIVDLATMPHLLMAGATGQGKSVGLNAILVSLLYKKHPSQLKLVLVDPKKVELSLYKTIEKHFLAKLPGEEEAIITDTKKVINTLNALCIEMDNRYDLLKEAGARNIKEYNEKFIRRRLNPNKGHQFLPFIVLVIDEFADLIMTAGKEVEMPIARLAQLARAVGIHLIIATQRPSVNIITGTIKANFPARIAFKVSSKIDSRTILDTGGAEQLIGKGDMLVSYNGEITRLQCAFVDTPEVESVCNFIGDQRGYPQAFMLPEYIDEKDLDNKDFSLLERDPLFEEAARLIVQNQVGSTSLIQRRMKLGYNRAGRLMDQLEAANVVGNNQGSKARDVLIKTEADLDQHLSLLG